MITLINILLVCSAGMSTTMLVNRMKESAAEKNIKAHIWSVEDANYPNEVEDADIILLGPQVRFLANKMKVLVGDKAPVELIEMSIYGSMNGEAALDKALTVLDEFNEKKNS